MEMPDRRGLTFAAVPNASVGFARRRSSPNPVALLFSSAVTAALVGRLLMVPDVADRVRPIDDALVVFSVTEEPAEDRELPEEAPVDEPELIADGPEEAAPSSRPRTVAPAPPVIPPAVIDLTPVPLSQAPAAEALQPSAGADGEGDLAQGPIGQGGKGGDGVAGDGSGGAGSGKGEGSQLIASWAPTMDFSQNYRFYPREARLAGIEGMARLRCFVLPRDRVRDCTVVAEKPSGQGFGAAALKTQAGLRVRVRDQAGRRIYNKWVVVESMFVLPRSKNPRPAAETKPGDGEAQP